MPFRRWRGSLPPEHPAPSIWGPYPTAVLADQPVNYWRLGDAASPPYVEDDSGFGRDITASVVGTFQQSGAMTTDTNTSVLCDGSTTNLFRSQTITTTGGWSVECWVRSRNGGNFSGGRDAWSFGGDGITNSNRLQIGLGGTVTSFVVFAGSPVNQSAGRNLSYDDWHQIVVTYNNGTTAWSIYIDGALAASTTHAGSVNTSAGIQIGGDYLGNDGIFNGYIQDVSFYQKELTAARVLAHFQAGAPARKSPIDVNSISRGGERRFMLYGGRRQPSRGKVWNAPPWPQRPENTNGYLLRRNDQGKWLRAYRSGWTRRGHVWGYPWPTVAVAPSTRPQVVHLRRPFGYLKRGHAVTPPWGPPAGYPGVTSISAGGERRFLMAALRARRGKVWSPQLYQAFPPNPVWPINADRQTLRVGWRQWQKRGHIWTPPYAQVIVAPNFVPKGASTKTVQRFLLARRGHSWEAPKESFYFSPAIVNWAGGNYSVNVVGSVTNWNALTTAWNVNQSGSFLSSSSFTINSPTSATWTFSLAAGFPGTFTVDDQLSSASLQVIEPSVIWQRQGRTKATNRQWQRRGHLWTPVFVQTTPVTPGITYQIRQPRVQRFWQRRGQTWDPAAWPQRNPPYPFVVLRQALTGRRPPYARRGHQWAPYLQQFNPPFPFEVIQQAQQVNRDPYMRRGHLWMPKQEQAFPPNPRAPINVNKSFVVRGMRAWQRRGKVIWPPTTTFFPNPAITFQNRQPSAFLAKRQWQRRGRNYMVWPQANPLTNGYLAPRVTRYTVEEALRQWQRRGHIWSPHLDQAFPPNPNFGSNFNVRRNYPRNYPYAKRQHFLDYPFPQPTFVNPVFADPRVRRAYPRNYPYTRPQRFWTPVPPQLWVPDPTLTHWQRHEVLYTRRGHIWLPKQEQAYPPNPQFGSNFQVRRGYPRNYPYAKRGKLWVPVLQQAAAPNPRITEWQVRRAYPKWYAYAKRHRVWSPHLDQAYPPNPPFAGNWWRKRTVPKWWFGPRRGHVFNLPWPQSPLGFIPSIGTYYLDDEVVTLYLLDDETIVAYNLDDETVTIYELGEDTF